MHQANSTKQKRPHCDINDHKSKSCVDFCAPNEGQNDTSIYEIEIMIRRLFVSLKIYEQLLENFHPFLADDEFIKKFAEGN